MASLLVAGCGHPVTSPDGASANAGGPETTVVGAAAKTVTLEVDAGGKSRLVIVHSPAGFEGPGALVFNLHGSGGTAAGEEAYSAMDAAADTHGFVVAYPQAAIVLGSGFAWNVPGQPLLGGQAVPPGSADDVDFIVQAIASIERAYSIDPKRVFATGMSGGGRMASQLGCALSTLLAAVAPVAGLRFPSPCDGQRPVPVVSFHGTADTVNPYDGNGQAYWTYSVPSAAQQWAAHDGCGASPATSALAQNVTLMAYSGCAGTAAVWLYAIDGAGHEWPGAPGQSTAIDANEAMWTFFSAHPLP